VIKEAIMTKRLKYLLPLLLMLASTAALAEDNIDHYAGRDAHGEKKYLNWPMADSIKVSAIYANAGEVSKLIYSCLVKYNNTSWYQAKVVSVNYDDETNEALIKVRLQYVFNHLFMRVVLTKDGDMTCKGITYD
jgi:hypothetical protein